MKLTLNLRFTDTVQRATAAWLIPGDDPRVWLEELCRWEVIQRELSLLVCTRFERGSYQTLGVLAICNQLPKHQSPLCRPYGVLARRLYLPVEARLDPLVTDDEIVRWLPSPDGHYVWHPTAGLIGYALDGALRVSDLLAPLELRAVNWDRAQPGIKLNDRLLSIEPDVTISLDDMLREAGGDIGHSASELGELPPHPDERGPAGKLARGFLGGMANALNWALKRPNSGQGSTPPPSPSGSGAASGQGASQQRVAGPSLLNHLQHWAMRTMQQVTESIQVERHRQLARLLQMLEKDPDLGLKYALPLSGNGAPRGIAAPGARLTQRDPNFSMGRIGGGGPVDVWDAGEYRAKLTQRYRELANRELALGRHRRAAYIFAELLGDLVSAAGALESGGHFREAAALYDQRLNQPQQAARCLVKGRLWSEAIAIYERLSQFETIGDLYRQLDDRENAEAAYERAVDQQLQRNDYLAAANLLERKIGSVERAYRCLLNAWPAAPQGAKCLEESFKLLARHERYDEADRLVRDYSSRKLDDATAAQWIERLSLVATEFPLAPVRELAADRTRVLVARQLEEEGTAHLPALTAAVARLAPGDRLLARDAKRFLDRRRSAATRVPTVKPNSLTLLRGYRLPMAEWKVAISVRKTFYAAGWRGRELLVLRGAEDVVQSLAETWTCEHADFRTDILLAAHPGALFKLVVHPLGLSPLPKDIWFSAMGRSFDDRMSAGSHPGLTPNTIGVHYAHAGCVTCFDANESDHILLRSYAGGYNELAGTLDIDLRVVIGGIIERPFVTQLSGSTALIGAGHHLVIAAEGRIDVDELPDKIQSLVCSAPYSAPRLAVGFEQGAMLFWGYRTTAQRERFAHDLISPVLAFTEGGHLIAAAEQGIEVYTMHNDRLLLVARQHDLFAAPLAVVSGGAPDQFRVLFRDGTTRVYKIAA